MRPLIVTPLALALLLGCVPSSTVPPLVVGPYAETPPWELFERMLEASRAEGYAPTDVDLDAGTFRVAPRTATGPDTAFVTRFYRGGWIQVVPVGPELRPEGGVTRVPPALRRELVQYVTALRRAAEVGS